MKCHPAVDGSIERLSSAHVEASATGSPAVCGQNALIARSTGDAASVERMAEMVAGLSRRWARIATAWCPSHLQAKAADEPGIVESTTAIGAAASRRRNLIIASLSATPDVVASRAP
jgi:hypothetical protein